MEGWRVKSMNANVECDGSRPRRAKIQSRERKDFPDRDADVLCYAVAALVW